MIWKWVASTQKVYPRFVSSSSGEKKRTKILHSCNDNSWETSNKQLEFGRASAPFLSLYNASLTPCRSWFEFLFRQNDLIVYFLLIVPPTCSLQYIGRHESAQVKYNSYLKAGRASASFFQLKIEQTTFSNHVDPVSRSRQSDLVVFSTNCSAGSVKSSKHEQTLVSLKQSKQGTEDNIIINQEKMLFFSLLLMQNSVWFLLQPVGKKETSYYICGIFILINNSPSLNKAN